MSDKKIIAFLDRYFDYNEFEFKTNIVEKVISFIMDSHYNIIENVNCADDEIIVCMPNYLLDYIIKEHINATNSGKYNLGETHICGLKTQFSYENSITVFYNGYTPKQIIKHTLQL